MARTLAIDYGSRRVGIAVTDPDKIIATGLTTVHSTEVISFLREYTSREEVDCFVVGDPKDLDNKPSQHSPRVEDFVIHLGRQFPSIPIVRIDERFTSSISKNAIALSVSKKSARRNKGLVDEVSATVILQSYLARKK